MSEFKTVTFQKDVEQPKDTRLIQMVLLLTLAFLIAYIFDPGPSRNIILFVIVTWGLLLHFSRYVFNKERSDASPKGELSIGDEHIKIGEIELSYDKIDFLNIYIDGYENQYQALDSQLLQSNGINNRLQVQSKGKVYVEYFKLISENHVYELIQALNGLELSMKEKIKLEKNPNRFNV